MIRADLDTSLVGSSCNTCLPGPPIIAFPLDQVGPEWHNDGSFCRNVFGHVVYHIIKAPEGPGNTQFAHLGKAFDLLPPDKQQHCRQCASVNSNGGVVHPLVHDHPISGRRSLYLHLGMTGAMIERVAEGGPVCNSYHPPFVQATPI